MFFEPTCESGPKRHLDRFGHFRIHCSKDSHSFSMGRTTRDNPKIPPFLGDLNSVYRPSWFSVPTRVSRPNTISIDSAVFARITNVTNTHTHRRTDTDRPTTLFHLEKQPACYAMYAMWSFSITVHKLDTWQFQQQ